MPEIRIPEMDPGLQDKAVSDSTTFSVRSGAIRALGDDHDDGGGQ
jgi:hypothetical protein